MPTTGQLESTESPRRLLIVGASARQTAQSACQIGRQCVAVDLFGDWDLAKFAEFRRVDSLDRLTAEWLREIARETPCDFIVTGGMENRCDLVSELSKFTSYLGTAPACMARAVDPFVLTEICNSHSIPFPEVVSKSANTDRESVWLKKPFKSAGGSRIRVYFPDATDTYRDSERCYFQRFIRGERFSSIFLANRRAACRIGTTVQLVGQAPFGNPGFSYCGSIGPIQHPESMNQELDRMGRILARELELAGIFGIDWVLEPGGRISLIEVNPRITASAEIFELVQWVPSIAGLHIECAQTEGIPNGWTESPKSFEVVAGKAILFSDSDVPKEVSPRFQQMLADWYAEGLRPTVADIPRTGSEIRPGNPILSLFAFGNTRQEVLQQLESAAVRCRYEFNGNHY